MSLLRKQGLLRFFLFLFFFFKQRCLVNTNCFFLCRDKEKKLILLLHGYLGQRIKNKTTNKVNTKSKVGSQYTIEFRKRPPSSLVSQVSQDLEVCSSNPSGVQRNHMTMPCRSLLVLLEERTPSIKLLLLFNQPTSFVYVPF